MLTYTPMVCIYDTVTMADMVCARKGLVIQMCSVSRKIKLFVTLNMRQQLNFSFSLNADQTEELGVAGARRIAVINGNLNFAIRFSSVIHWRPLPFTSMWGLSNIPWLS